jgi:hypothetical protein
MTERARRPKKDPADRSRSAVKRRAAGRTRWRRWAALRRSGAALCLVRFDGAAVAKLIVAGWLPRRPDDHGYGPEEVAAAIAEMIAKADLPKKSLTR